MILRTTIIITLVCCEGLGYLLQDGVHLKPSVPKLPQYTLYGKSMVLVGGNLWDNNTEVYDTIIRIAGGKGVAKIGIINAASADPLGGFQFYRDQFLKYGVLEANRIPVDLNHTDNNAKQEVLELIYNQTGFFFGGGDQARVIQSFLGNFGDFSPALIALHQMFDSGAVISGTSAGTTCQTANYMIKSGVSYDALLYGSFPDHEPDSLRRDAMVYSSVGGLGFMKGYVLDTHFSQRGREGRMIRMLSDTMSLARGSSYGIGVDENTALVVTNADTEHASGQVIGASGVSVFDLSKSQARRSTVTHFNITNVYMTYLTHGDVILFSNRSVTFSQRKSPMSGHENYDDVLTSDDVFYGTKSGSSRKSEFVRMATSVFDARNSDHTHGFTYEIHPRFRVNVNGKDGVGWVERKHSFHSDITSYKKLRVDIFEG